MQAYLICTTAERVGATTPSKKFHLYMYINYLHTRVSFTRVTNLLPLARNLWPFLFLPPAYLLFFREPSSLISDSAVFTGSPPTLVRITR